MTILTKTVEISPDALLKAISLRASNGFNALCIARVFGRGGQDDAWDLAEKHNLAELISEAETRDLSLIGLKSAVDGITVLHSAAYLYTKGRITKEDYNRYWNSLKRGDETAIKEAEERFAVLGELSS